MSAFLSAARDLTRQGLPIFPILPRLKTPFGGMHVCNAPTHQHGYLDATRDTATIAAWWSVHPDANVGLATGRGVDVLDVDGPEGEATLAGLVARRWPLPETCEVRTSPGHRQLYFLSARWPCTASKLGPGLDTRGLGGYVLVPPSVHPSGATYTCTHDAPPAAAPAWLTALLLRPVTVAPPVRRPVRLASRYAAAALEDASLPALGAPSPLAPLELDAEASASEQPVVAPGAPETDEEGFAKLERLRREDESGVTDQREREARQASQRPYDPRIDTGSDVRRGPGRWSF